MKLCIPSSTTRCWGPIDKFADCTPRCYDNMDQNSCSCSNSDFPEKWPKPTCPGKFGMQIVRQIEFENVLTKINKIIKYVSFLFVANRNAIDLIISKTVQGIKNRKRISQHASKAGKFKKFLYLINLEINFCDLLKYNFADFILK